jgi:hypothetical protein
MGDLCGPISCRQQHIPDQALIVIEPLTLNGFKDEMKNASLQSQEGGPVGLPPRFELNMTQPKSSSNISF